MNLIDIYRTIHPNTKEYTVFSAPHGTVSKIDHMLNNKTNLKRYKKIGMTPCILLDHNGLKLKFKNKINCRKSPISWKLSSAQLNHSGSRKKSRKKYKTFWNPVKMKAQRTQTCDTL